MNLADGFLRQWLVGARSALLDQPAFVESPGDRPEPLRRLRMPPGVVFEKQRVGIEEGHVTRAL